MKIVTIVGARPQFIKVATVSRALKELRPDVSEVIVHTGQHFEANMSDVFFEQLKIAHPAHQLGIGGGTHGQNTGRMLEAIEQVLLTERPDLALVYGDTDTTLAGALAAAKLHIPIAHVEAGLRSGNMKMPEEVNRVLVDRISSSLYCPTASAQRNLLAEGTPEQSIRIVGDVMYDAALYYSELATRQSTILKDLRLKHGDFVLATLHRAENVDDAERLKGIMARLATSPLPVLFPLHPRTRARLERLELEVAENIKLLAPLGYLDMIMLEKSSALIVTDSGGVQKEAYFHGRPCLVVRKETEWVELVQIGAAKLADDDWWSQLDGWVHPQEKVYGSGDASKLIALDLGR